MSSQPHRIDPPSTSVPRMVGPRGGGPPVNANSSGPQPPLPSIVSGQPAGEAAPQHQATACPASSLELEEQWLRLHSGDLIDRLQSWASDLDAREAQLNARSSLLDHRERRSRLQQQDLSTELAEQQRSVARLRAQVEAHARRLAFQQDSDV